MLCHLCTAPIVSAHTYINWRPTSPIVHALPCNVILRNCSPGNHDCCGVLDLHFSQKDVAVLGELDVCNSDDATNVSDDASGAAATSLCYGVIRLHTSSATYKHLDSPFWPEVGLHDIVQSLRSIYVHEESCPPPHDLSLGVECLHRSHVAAGLPPRPANSAIRKVC